MPEASKPAIVVNYLPAPETVPAAPPYATTSFTYLNNDVDVTICFMRPKLMGDAEIAAFVAAGGGQLEAPVVGAITLPRRTARDLAEKLAELIKASGG